MNDSKCLNVLNGFGVILPWTEWENKAARIQALGIPFLSEPAVLLSGTSEEQAKFYLQDTSHNVIEVKAYRNLAHTLGVDGNWVARART